MESVLHPLAPHHLPGFVTAPGESDFLLNLMIVLLIGAVLMIGNLYLKLHSLPERMAHRTTQFQIVAVLGLLALFTHQHIFWIAALMLALVRLPDFTTPLNRIADSLEAGNPPVGPPPAPPRAEHPPAQHSPADHDPHGSDLPEPR